MPESRARLRPPGAVFLGLLGVVGFSLTLPATRVAVEELDATVVGLGRALIAALLAGIVLLAVRGRRPVGRQWARLAVVGLGVVVGFPLFTALALRSTTSAHSAVIVGLLPAATAAAAVLRAGERPSPRFWLACAAGLFAVLAFAASEGAGWPGTDDGFVLLAVASAAIGYAEGGALARDLGGWRVICWALVLTAPALVPVVAVAAATSGLHAGASAWAGFAYVALVSMFLAFFAWYRALAAGGVARIGQLQLVQPVLTLGWSALLLGESVGPVTVLAAVCVLACAAITQRTRVTRVAGGYVPRMDHQEQPDTTEDGEDVEEVERGEQDEPGSMSEEVERAGEREAEAQEG